MRITLLLILAVCLTAATQADLDDAKLVEQFSVYRDTVLQGPKWRDGPIKITLNVIGGKIYSTAFRPKRDYQKGDVIGCPEGAYLMLNFNTRPVDQDADHQYEYVSAEGDIVMRYKNSIIVLADKNKTITVNVKVTETP